MRTSSRLLSACVAMLCLAVAAPTHAQSATANAATNASQPPSQYGKLPLLFEANRGQANDQVQFLSHTAGELLLLEKDQAVLRLAAHSSRSAMAPSAHPALASHDDLKIRFAGASPNAEIVALDEQAGKSNYILGNNPAKWHTNVENYSRVRYNSLYPGVDLVFYGNPSHLEHDFIVAPGADYRAIALELTGSRKIRLAHDGSVRIVLANGEVQFSAPRIYQLRDGQEVAINGSYKLSKNQLAFNIGPHDATLPLVIDPILSYSTYLAGTSDDIASGIALDSAGNAYITGETFSTDFPTLNPYQPACNNCANAADIFVTKLNSTGTALVYSTYLGGSNIDQPSSIAVDGSGHAIVGGQTQSTDFPLKNATHINTSPNEVQGFVASLSKDGTSLNFSTLLGGSRGGYVSSVATDSHANVYAEGQTASSDFPVKPTTNVIGAAPAYPIFDVFVAKFSAVGALQFATAVGLDPDFADGGTFIPYPAYGSGIAVDSDQDIYISGWTGPGFLVTPGAFQTTFRVQQSGTHTELDLTGFIAELKPDGSAFTFASYLGGSGVDEVTAITLDANRNIYMTGAAGSTDFPVTPGAFQSTPPSSGYTESFVTKMNPSGSALVYSSYFGGTSGIGSTWISGIALDADGEAFVTGGTSDRSFPLLDPLQTTLPAGENTEAAFVTKFNATGSAILFSTIFSGSNGALSSGIAVNPALPNYVFIAGTSEDTNLPTTTGAFQTTVAPPPPNAGVAHAFVTKFDLSVPSPVVCANQTTLSFVAPFNQNSAPTPVVLTNCGNSSLTVSGVTVSGPFTQTNNCQSAVAPGTSCTVNVVFRATTPGTYTGALSISDNAPIQPLLIAMTGRAVAPTVEVSSPFRLDDQLVGQTGNSASLFVFNNGNDTLSITTVNETGPDFSASKRYCLNVQPGGACYIMVTFHPTAAGARTGTLTLIDNAPDSPQTVALQGNGLTSYPVPTISSIVPNMLLQDSAAQTINVQGGEFFQSSKILVAGTALATTYNGESGLSATIPANMLKSIGELPVQVFTPTPGGGISNTSIVSVYQDIPIGASNLVYEPYTRKIYASMGSTSATNPNSIISIDPETGTLGAPISVGANANPNHLALTADGSFLYVGLDGTNAVQQLKLPSGALGTSTSLAAVNFGAPELGTAYDLTVVPGKEQIYVASLAQQFSTPSEVGLVANAKLLTTSSPFSTTPGSVCFLSDPLTFYASDIYSGAPYKFSIVNNYTSLAPPTSLAVPNNNFGNAFACDSKYIYDNAGHVYDPVAQQLLGTYNFGGQYTGNVLPDTSVSRTYAVQFEANILAFDQASFAQVDSAPLPSTNSEFSSLLRWGTDGFAYLSFNSQTGGGDLILQRSSITQPNAGPNPVPTIVHSIPQVPAGSGNYQLTITGTNFVPGAVVEWNGAIRTTIFQNSSTLIADIPASDVATAGTATITVVNPPFTGAASNKHSYTILPAK